MPGLLLGPPFTGDRDGRFAAVCGLKPEIAPKSEKGRLCCKSRFAPLTKDFPGCRRGFRVNMWGTSSPGGELTGDFGNEPDANIYQRSWLVSSSGGEFVTCRFQTFATQSARFGHPDQFNCLSALAMGLSKAEAAWSCQRASRAFVVVWLRLQFNPARALF
jgi:hypothetical protein